MPHHPPLAEHNLFFLFSRKIVLPPRQRTGYGSVYNRMFMLMIFFCISRIIVIYFLPAGVGRKRTGESSFFTRKTDYRPGRPQRRTGVRTRLEFSLIAHNYELRNVCLHAIKFDCVLCKLLSVPSKMHACKAVENLFYLN